MKRRDFLFFTASSAGVLLPTLPYFAASGACAELSVSGDGVLGEERVCPREGGEQSRARSPLRARRA